MIHEYCKRIDAEIERCCSRDLSRNNIETILFLLKSKEELMRLWYKRSEKKHDEGFDYDEYIEHSHKLTHADIQKWYTKMENSSGTKGMTYTVFQTDKLAEELELTFDKFDEEEWNVAVNMMYSDYYTTAVKFGCNVPLFYASLAKDFLCDEDGGGAERKLSEYYHHIVES